MSENEKKDIEGIEIERQQLDSTFKAKLITSNSFAKLVNEIFSNISPDYEGCGSIQFDADGRPYCMLEFSASSAEGTKIVEPIGGVVTDRKTGKPSMMGVISSYNMRSKTNNKFKLTEEAKKLFAKYVPKHRSIVTRNINASDPNGADAFIRKDISIMKNGKINWNELYSEQTEQYQYGYNMYKIYSYIPIDIYTLLGDMYGRGDDAGKFEYVVKDVSAIGPVMQTPTGIVGNRMMIIMQLASSDINELAKDAGMIPTQNNMGINRIRN